MPLPDESYPLELAEIYFNESGADDDSPVVCVAGYIFKVGQSIAMEKEWNFFLGEHKLPCFQMADCVHANKSFEHISLYQRRKIETSAINIINAHIAYGFAISVDKASFNRIMPKSDTSESAYGFCLNTCLAAVRDWADKNDFNGNIAYFFESGHVSQNEANSIMNGVIKNRALKRQFRYFSHSFADRKMLELLQTADILAWAWGNDKYRWQEEPSELLQDIDIMLKKGMNPPDHSLLCLHWEDRMLENLALQVHSQPADDGVIKRMAAANAGIIRMIKRIIKR